MNSLKINTLNLNGWTHGSAELKGLISTYSEPHVICLVETHLKENELINLPGYRCYHKHRTIQASRGSGGVCVLVRDGVYGIYSVQRVDCDLDGILCLKFCHSFTGYETVVVCSYLPPCGSEFGRDPESFFGTLLGVNYEFYNVDMIYMSGDLNARIGQLSDVRLEGLELQNRLSCDVVVNSHGRCFLDFLNDSLCCVLNGRLSPPAYTCHMAAGSSTVDYAFVPCDLIDRVKSFQTINVEEMVNNEGWSKLVEEGSKLPDHDLLQAVINTSGHYLTDFVRGLGAKAHSPTKPKPVPRRFHPEFMENERIKSLLIGKIEELAVCEQLKHNFTKMYNELCDIIRAEMDLYHKIGKRKSTPHKPYWCPLLSQLWKAMREAYKDAKKFLNSRDKKRRKLKTSTIPQVVRYRTAMQQFDKELRLAKRKYQVDKIVDLENLVRNPKKFWNAVNKLGPRKKSSDVCEAFDERGEVTRDPDIVNKHWHNEYAKLYGSFPIGEFDEEHYKEKSDAINLDDEDGRSEDINRSITADELKQAVKLLKKGKACGLDNIPNEVLEMPLCVSVMVRLFNLCLDSGMIPELWSQCIILPIGKGDATVSTDPLTHRGLALQCCIYKLYSLVINRRLNNYFESNELLHETQNGFRRNRGCVDHVFTLAETIRLNLSQSDSTVVACFVDLKKAFPSVNRNLLLYKLQQYGVKGKVIRAIAAVYDKPQYCVRVNGQHTDMFPSVLGLPEGDPNSPLSFSVFLNDLLCELQESGLGIYYGSGLTDRLAVLAYADDLVLISNTEEKLQGLLDILARYCKKWRLSVNVDKTKSMSFRRSRCATVQDLRVRYCGEVIEQVSNYKYLGVVMDELLHFGMHVDRVASAGSRALGSVINRTRELRDLGFMCYDKLLKSCVFSVLDYGSEVTGFANCKQVEDVQNRASRFYLGVPRGCPLPCLNAEMGWYNTETRWFIAALRFYDRILKMGDERLPKKIFMNTRNNPKSWAGKLRKGMEKYSLEVYFDILSPVPSEICEFQIRENYKEKVLKDINELAKLRTYRLLRVGLEVGTQVKCVNGKQKRSLLTQLKCGILPIRLETGRYNREAVNERVCLYCNTDAVETEDHLVFDCPLYSEERKDFFSALNLTFDQRNLRKCFDHPFVFGGFIAKLWDKRRATDKRS